MEINRVDNIYKNYMASPISNNKIDKFENSTMKIQDRIDISNQGAFRSKLNQEIKKNSANVTKSVNSQEKIQELKEQYKDDVCPIDSNKLAQSILSCICGINLKESK